jgi:bacillithiol system protein YtxJ
MRLYQLDTPEAVDAFLAQFPTAGIFKAGTCHKTMQGFGVLESFLQRYDLPVGVIRVVEWRPASNHAAQRSGVVHQSPQFLLFEGGECRFDADNWDITEEALAPAFARYAQESGQQGAAGQLPANLEPYLRLMRSYLEGELDDQGFQDRYVTMFRNDPSLRSREEFELLSRLFGDPDAFHGGLHQLGAPSARGDLRGRVQALLGQLAGQPA